MNLGTGLAGLDRNEFVPEEVLGDAGGFGGRLLPIALRAAWGPA